MEEELKENKCEVIFYCQCNIDNPCVYFVDAGDGINCRHGKTILCESAVANVNSMILGAKAMGISLVQDSERTRENT